jgi:hypothetical protein
MVTYESLRPLSNIIFFYRIDHSAEWPGSTLVSYGIFTRSVNLKTTDSVTDTHRIGLRKAR